MCFLLLIYQHPLQKTKLLSISLIKEGAKTGCVVNSYQWCMGGRVGAEEQGALGIYPGEEIRQEKKFLFAQVTYRPAGWLGVQSSQPGDSSERGGFKTSQSSLSITMRALLRNFKLHKSSCVKRPGSSGGFCPNPVCWILANLCLLPHQPSVWPPPSTVGGAGCFFSAFLRLSVLQHH